MKTLNIAKLVPIGSTYGILAATDFNTLTVFEKEEIAKVSKDSVLLAKARVDIHDLVRQAYASNKNINLESLSKAFDLSENVDYALLIGAASNPRASSKQLLETLDCDLVLARISAAGNPSADEKVLMWATHESQPLLVRMAAVANPSLTLSAFRQLDENCVQNLHEKLISSKFFTIDRIMSELATLPNDLSLKLFLEKVRLDKEGITRIFNIFVKPFLQGNDLPEIKISNKNILPVGYAEALLKLKETSTEIILSLLEAPNAFSLPLLFKSEYFVTMLAHPNANVEVLKIALEASSIDIVSAAYASPNLSNKQISYALENYESSPFDNYILDYLCANPKLTNQQLKMCIEHGNKSAGTWYDLSRNISASSELLATVLENTSRAYIYKSLAENPSIDEETMFTLFKKGSMEVFKNKSITEKVLTRIIKERLNLPSDFWTCPKITDELIFLGYKENHIENFKFFRHPSEELQLRIIKDEHIADEDKLLLINNPYLTDKVYEYLLNIPTAKYAVRDNVSFAKLKSIYTDVKSSSRNITLNNKLTGSQLLDIFKAFYEDSFSSVSQIFNTKFTPGSTLKSALELVVTNAKTSSVQKVKDLKLAVLGTGLTNDILRDLLLNKDIDESVKVDIFKRPDIKVSKDLINLGFEELTENISKASAAHIVFSNEKQYEVITKFKPNAQVAMLSVLKTVDLLVLAIASKSDNDKISAEAKKKSSIYG